jgi:hypothetical protein
MIAWRAFAMLALAIGALTRSTTGHAADDDGPTFADVVLADAAIPYRDAEAGNAAEWKDCDWNRSMMARLVERSEGRVHVADAAPSIATRRRLALVVQTMHVVGGSTFSGPKWLVIEGRLTDGDEALGSFEARRQSYRGSLRACATIRDLADDIADDIVEWLDAPKPASKLGDAR